MMKAEQLAKLYERVNDLNTKAAVNNTGKTYWTVIVLYNRVIYERDQDGVVAIHEVVGEAKEAHCGCGGPCHRCAGKCSCTRCCHAEGSEA